MKGPNLGPLLSPQSIAVVGVTRRDHSPSRIIVENLKAYPYPAPVYLINPSGESIGGLPTFPDIASLPEPVDLAMVMVPAPQGVSAIRECLERGVRSAVICSAGWADDPRPEGAARQAELTELVKGTDLLLAGPNSEGFLNLHQRVPVCFSSSISLPAIDRCLPYTGLSNDELASRATGNVAIIAQSGGIGFSLFNRGLTRGVRFSKVISTGNEVGLEMQDFADYLIDDPVTDVICMYIEGLNNMARFPNLAARARQQGKKLVVAKVGRSAAAKRAALSHTGHIAGDDAAFDAVFRAHGVVRAEDPEEMLDIALALSQSPPLRNCRARAAVVSYSGGSAVWMADACARRGVELPELSAPLQDRLRKVLPPFAATANPVDISGASQLKPAQIAALVVPDPDIDAVVLITTLRNVSIFDDERPALEQMQRELGKPLLIYSYTEPSIESRQALAELRLPAFTSIDRCAAALAALARAATADSAPPPPLAPPTMPDRLVLTEYDTYGVLASIGLAAEPHRFVTSPAEAATAARELGFPVALKVQAPDIAHKVEAGGVALGLALPADVEQAYAAMRARVGTAVDGYLVQRMAPPGIEVVVGVQNRSGLGPMVVLGWGGSLVEVIDRRVIYPAPFDERRANALLTELGADRVIGDAAPLASLIARISQLAAALAGDLAELDLNPVIIERHSGAVHIVDGLAVRSSTTGGAHAH